IEVTRGGEAYRYYNINGDGSKHDYIDNIQECTSSSSDKSCKYALTFDYKKDTSDVGFAVAANQTSGIRTTTLLTDFNGDGRSDFLYTNSTGKVLSVKIAGHDTDVITSNLKSVNDFKLTDVNGMVIPILSTHKRRARQLSGMQRPISLLRKRCRI
ncbi:hypothetical protein AC626_12180, partial [Pseudoalteromonas rubra]